MWLQYRESTWAIIRRQLLPVSGICAIPPTQFVHLNKQIHRDARQPQKCWNHKRHAWLFLFSNAWFFPKTSYMHRNYTYFMPLSLQSTLSSSTKSTWSETWNVFTVHMHSWSKNSVLFLVEFHFRISCLSTKLLLSLFQVYALMHTLWAWSGPVQAT